MERIEFRYNRHDEFDSSDEGQEITFIIKDKDNVGIHDYDVCGKFVDFMRAVGYSERSVIDYFNQN